MLPSNRRRTRATRIGHIDPAIRSQIDGELPVGGWYGVRIPIADGQVLGTFGGSHGIDFFIIDTDVTRNGFIIPQHYDAEAWKIHVVDFFDYLDEVVTADLMKLNVYRRQYWAAGNQPDPATVTVASGIVKYELVYAGLYNNGDPFDASRFGVQGVLLAQLLTPPPAQALSIRIEPFTTPTPARRAMFEVFPGKSASQVTGFTSAASVYER